MSTETVPSAAVPSLLTDNELAAAVERLAHDARRSTAQLVAHLAEFDARRLYLRAGCDSLFAYCFEVLRLSEHASYNRIQAARAARDFPVIVDRLAEGTLNLTTVRLLAPHLSRENHLQLLDEAAGLRRPAVEEIVARVSPRPDVATTIRRVPEASRGLPLDATPPSASLETPSAGTTSSMARPSAPTVTLVEISKRQPVVVLAPGRYEIRFTASAATREKLRAAQELLRHAVPDGDTAEVIDRALTVLLDSLLKNKTAAADRPRAASTARPGTRTIPAAVRRAVWLRDGARCAFVAANGRRCTARAFLEFHHVQPYAVGGPATVDNIALRCHAHNQHERELAFGPLPVGIRTRGRGLMSAHSTRSETS
jgi:hypothetical protein